VPVGQPCFESEITKEITGPGEAINNVIANAKVKYKVSMVNNLKIKPNKSSYLVLL
jgi:hypothetical protein